MHVFVQPKLWLGTYKLWIYIICEHVFATCAHSFFIGATVSRGRNRFRNDFLYLIEIRDVHQRVGGRDLLEMNFSKFYGNVGVIFLFLFHLIWKNYWEFDLKSWIVDFFTRFTRKKTTQNNFSSQNFSVENNYFWFSTKVKE